MAQTGTLLENQHARENQLVAHTIPAPMAVPAVRYGERLGLTKVV